MTDGRTDGRTDGQTDGGDCNIPDAFLKKRGDKYFVLHQNKCKKALYGFTHIKQQNVISQY